MRSHPRQRLRKFGMPRKALASVEGREGLALTPQIRVVDYPEERVEEVLMDSVEQIKPYLETSAPTWIDVSGQHPLTTVREIGELFELHSVTLEDILDTDQRPKVEEFPGYIYIVIQKPIYDPEDKRFGLEQVSIVLTAKAVLSFHQHMPSRVTPIRSRMIQERRRICRLGTDYLAYVIVDSIVDEFYMTMENSEGQIQHLEEELAEEPTPATMKEIYQLKQETLVLRRSFWPLREVIAVLAKTESPLFDEQIKVYLKDLRDHILQIVDLIDVYRDMLSGLLDLYLTVMSHRTNQVMKTLTMIASVFIPLTLITGIYGMNFVDMPELHWKYGYPAVLGVMGLVGIGMVFFFKRRGWI